MKTKFTNRNEKACNFIRKQSKMIGAFMLTIMLSGNIAFAQHAISAGTVEEVSVVQNEAVQKNPVALQPGKITPAPSPAFIPLCQTITSMEMIDKSSTVAILGWDTSINYDSITIRYALTGTSNYTSVLMRGTPNPGLCIIQGLVAQTSYDFEISTKCSSGGTSNWSSPLSLTTFPEPAPRLAANQRNSNMLSLNPNPAIHYTTLSFTAPVNSSHLIIISNSSGREILKTTEICTAGKIQIPVNLTNIPPGLYFVRVYSGTSMSVERLIVQ